MSSSKPFRPEQLHLRLSQSEIAVIRKCATKKGLSVSDFVRLWILETLAPLVALMLVIGCGGTVDVGPNPVPAESCAALEQSCSSTEPCCDGAQECQGYVIGGESPTYHCAWKPVYLCQGSPCTGRGPGAECEPGTYCTGSAPELCFRGGNPGASCTSEYACEIGSHCHEGTCVKGCGVGENCSSIGVNVCQP